MKYFLINKKLSKLGENAKENHKLFDNALPNDWWFHLNDMPSGHLIIESKKINRSEIKCAALIVKNNSKYKNFKKVKVCYLQIKDLKKSKTDGEVILKKTPNIISV